MFAHFEIYYFLQQLCFVLPINCNQYLFVFIYTTKDFFSVAFFMSLFLVSFPRIYCTLTWRVPRFVGHFYVKSNTILFVVQSSKMRHIVANIFQSVQAKISRQNTCSKFKLFGGSLFLMGFVPKISKFDFSSSEQNLKFVIYIWVESFNTT